MKGIYEDAHFAYLVKTLVEQISNDLQLGEEVRKLYWESENERD